MIDFQFFFFKTLYFEIYSLFLFNSNAGFKTRGTSNGQGWDIKPGLPIPGQYSGIFMTHWLLHGSVMDATKS